MTTITEPKPGTTIGVMLPPLHTGQQQVEDSDARFKVVCAGRRWGKTRFGVRECLKRALQGQRAWWVAPVYQTAKEGWIPLRQIAGHIPNAKIREADKELWLPGGGRVTIRSADNPDMLRGAGLDFVVLDESAYMQERVWHEILRPALADRKGHALFISTPVGFNWFYDLYEMGESDKYPEWAAFHAPSYENPFLDPAELDAAKEEVGSHVFSQEFMAEFVEVGGGLFKQDWFRYFQVLPIDRTDPETGETHADKVWLVNNKVVEPRDCRRFVVVDPAVSLKQTADYTAIAACAITPDDDLLVLHMHRRRMEGPDILPVAQAVADEWASGGIIYLEKNAFQLMLVQEARRRGMLVGELVADRDKVARALPLAARFEAGRVYFQRQAAWLPDLERELLVFPLETEHDDQVDVLAYAATMMAKRVSWLAY